MDFGEESTRRVVEEFRFGIYYHNEIEEPSVTFSYVKIHIAIIYRKILPKSLTDGVL